LSLRFPLLSDEAFLNRTTKELVSIISSEWLEESELSSEVIQIHKDYFNALYNPVVGVNIMTLSFAHEFLKHMSLSPTTKLTKRPSGQIIQSSGILYVLPIQVRDTKVRLSFHIFDIIEFDMLIGQLIERLLIEGQRGNLNISLGKDFKLHLSTHSTNAKIEPSPEPDPMEVVKEVSLEHHFSPNLEEDVEFYIEEEEENPIESEPLHEFEEPFRPPIELKPLPPGLRYTFLDNDPESPVIITDKLTQDETLKLMTVLEVRTSSNSLWLLYTWPSGRAVPVLIVPPPCRPCRCRCRARAWPSAQARPVGPSGRPEAWRAAVPPCRRRCSAGPRRAEAAAGVLDLEVLRWPRERRAPRSSGSPVLPLQRHQR